MAIITQSDNLNNSYTIDDTEVDEFLPIVRFKTPSRYVVEGEELVQSDEKSKLSKYLEKDKSEFTILQLTTEKQKVKLPFTIKKGSSASWDDDGYIEPKLSIEDDTIKITSNKKTKAKYDSEIEVELEFTSKKSKEFYLDFYANDDENLYLDNEGEYKNVHCGRIRVVFFKKEKDIFDKEEVERLVKELKYIKPLADQKEDSPFTEYRENYCMQAAERGLSELLKDDKHFYSVERGTHSHKNRIGFSGKTAIDRGNKLESLGFVKNIIAFNGYQIDHKERKTIKDRNSYALVNYSIISFKPNEKVNLQSQIEKDIDGRMGFHVYYFTVTNGFHTLLLVIDNSNTKLPTYQIYDQHGASKTSFGSLSEVTEGIRKQTSWTFANTCLNRYESNKSSSWDATNTYLWKIQRK